MASTTLVFNPARLRVALERSDISNRQVGRALSYDSDDLKAINGYVNRFRQYLNGRRVPKPPTIEKLADALGCRVIDLCDEAETDDV